MGRNVIKRWLITPLSMVCNHPFLFGMTPFVVLVYRYCPSLFGFLLSSSPVIGCTLLFLWVIVNSSEQPVNSNTEDLDRKHDCPKEERNFLFPYQVSRREEKEGEEAQGLKLEEGELESLMKKTDDMLGNLIVGDDEKNYRDVGTSLELESNRSLGNLIVGDDEKNYRDMGTSLELESNQRLENLIVGDGEKNYRDVGTSSELESNQSLGNLIVGDDEKNYRDVGTSLELESNQRLENLIAKRRSRKYQRSTTEKNLIDFKTNDQTTVVEELSRLLVLLPPRKNQLDVPSTTHKDLVRSSHDDGIITLGDCPRHQGILKRNETFTSGMSTSDFRHERRTNTRTRPVFKAHRPHSIRIKSQLNGKHYFMSDDDDDCGGDERSTKTNQRGHNENNVYNSRTKVVKKHWMSVRSRVSHAMKQIAAEGRLDDNNDSNSVSTVNSVEEPLHYLNRDSLEISSPPPASIMELGISKPGYPPPS